MIDVDIIFANWHTVDYSPAFAELAELVTHFFFTLRATSPRTLIIVNSEESRKWH